uniref:Uncharacterized protein n=1 Tax=Glossina palpalis gambiensis TaxID=67801 RepID=A0A1B0BI46_9MUSC
MSLPYNTRATPRLPPRMEQQHHFSWDESHKQNAIIAKSPTRTSSSPLPLRQPKPSRDSRVHVDNTYNAALRSSNNPYDDCSEESYNTKKPTTYANREFSDDDLESVPSYYQTPTSGKHSSRKNSSDSPSNILCGSNYSTSLQGCTNQSNFVFEPISPKPNSGVYKKFKYYEHFSPEKDNIDDDYFGTSSIRAPMSPKIVEPDRRNSTKRIFTLKKSSTKKQEEWEMTVTPNRDEHDSNRDYEKADSSINETMQLSVDSEYSTTGTTTTVLSYSDTSTRQSSNELSHASPSLCQRRHAINITSNPGYQVLHSSHSTLDRTRSDSVVSLRYRKSTSDLTQDTDNELSRYNSRKGFTKSPGGSFTARRRSSSKGGLAYLASRRSSRESMKSAFSNTSIASNDDVGPLAFQASNRGHQRRTSNFLELPVPDHFRPRVCSLPDRPYNPRASDDLYRLRHFSISKGNVVNCGDSIISRHSRSNTSINSNNSRASGRSPFESSCCGAGYANVDSTPLTPEEDVSENLEPIPPRRYRIVMLGDPGVGKTALVNQFMTSEYMHTYDASLDDEFGEKTVSVLLDDEESELIFVDHPSVEMSVENCLSTYEPHGCVVVFSVVDKTSFRKAEETINYLWQESYPKDKAVILVGNKADLARARVISSQDGKSLAASRDAKFIETSSGIQHNVDELLVGILKQIRLKESREKKANSTKIKPSRTHMSLHLAKEILQKICLTDISKSKSCENLHVL